MGLDHGPRRRAPSRDAPAPFADDAFTADFDLAQLTVAPAAPVLAAYTAGHVDQAHRIGQMRPVTIYRLVTKGTIEQQIVELHRSKRELADRLLEGAEAPAKLTTREPLDLIWG